MPVNNKTMKRIISLFASFFLVQILGAQVTLSPTVIASAGGFEQGGDISISWTLGEVAVTTLYGDNLILTQGFQQPYTIGTSINLNEVIDWNIKAYPNPVREELMIQFDLKRTDDFWIEIQDVTGRTIDLKQHKSVKPGDILTIEMAEYKYGIYFFKIYTPDRTQMRVLSIRKI